MPTASGSKRLGQHLRVAPDTIQFNNVKLGGNVPSATVLVTNLDQAAPRSINIKAPTTRWFKVRGVSHTQRVAPGLSISFEVIFDATAVSAQDQGRDSFHDCIKVTSEGQTVELWVHAFMPCAQLHLEGDLQFGMVAVDSKYNRQLLVTNKGQLQADYRLDWDKSLPVSVDTDAGILQAGSCASISVQLAAHEVGPVAGELLVYVAGRAEPYRQSLSAAVVQQSFELLDASSIAISEINFGSLFLGETTTRTIKVLNNGPSEARFDLSYGSKADMATIAATDNDGPADDDQCSAFMRLARIRAKLREEKESVVRVSPSSGTIAPYGTAQLQVTFRPPSAAQAKGFKSQLSTSSQDSTQAFEYLIQLNMTGGKLLQVPVKGYGLAPTLAATPQVMHLGVVPTYEWADQLLELCNKCQELPMHVRFDRSGPYFTVEPAQLDLPPAGSTCVLVRYLPKALGRHQASLSFQVLSSLATDKVISETVVQVQGQSLSVGRKRPLPGGIDATPETFIKPRAYVDEGEATIALHTAKNTYKRPALWDTAENAYTLEGIGPRDRFGVTREVQVARRDHADQYTTFIRAGRTATARKYLTQKEGDEADRDLGMKPYRGLTISLFEQPKQHEPLWTLKLNDVLGPSVQRPPSAPILASVPTHKEWPQTEQERAECAKDISPEQLSKITVGPRQIDFGKVSPTLPATQCFVVTNSMNTAIHVVLDTSSVEGLSCSGPASQVIPPGSMGKFQLVLRSHVVQPVSEQIQYCINGCHIQSLDILADVVAVTLDLSSEELVFAFGLENWDDYVEQNLIMENTHNFPVEYEWAMSNENSVFSVSPASGTIKPKSSCSVIVRWTPGNADHAAIKDSAAVTAQPPGSASTASGRTAHSKRVSTAESLKDTNADSTAAAVDGKKQGISASTTAAVSVSLTGADAAEAVAVTDGAALGCQHTGFMSLKLKGGADAAPKKVMLLGELPAGLLKLNVKEVNLGPVPLHEEQTVNVQLKNFGSAGATYRVHSNSQLQVSQDRGHVAAESAAELEVLFTPKQSGQFAAVLEVEVRGGKTLKLPIRAEPMLPCCHIAESSLKFTETFIGSQSQMSFTLVNTTPVPATLICDFIEQPEFDITISREAWAGAGYTACPVQKIGANGEMTTVGSKRASKRTSRRLTFQGGKPPLAGDSGYRFLFQMKPSSTLPLQLVYRPSRAHAVEFLLPIVMHINGGQEAAVQAPVPVRASASAQSRRGSTPGSQSKASAAAPAPVLAVPVAAVGVMPKLISSKTSISFDSQVVLSNKQPGKSPYTQEIYMRNNTEAALQVAVGVPNMHEDCAGCLGVYTIESLDAVSWPIVLEPEEGFGVLVRFNPRDARSYQATLPIYIDGNNTLPYLEISLSGMGMLPQLTFSVAECVLPPVPLNITSRARFQIINGGYDNLEVSVRLPPDTTRLPLSLSFPEGNLIGLAKDRLPVEVSFCSSRPQSFTAMVDFLDETGRAFSIAVTGTTDSCSLTHGPFMQANLGQLQLLPAAEGSVFAKLQDSAAYEMPWDEIVGPQLLPEGVAKFFSAISPPQRGHAANNRSGSGEATATNDGSTSTFSSDDLRHSMKNSKGKQLIELIELLSGKGVSVKGANSKKVSGNKTEAAQQTLFMYETILTHLRAYGALINTVKPEYLLTHDDFEIIMEARTAAAAGIKEQEQALELWAPVEQSFALYSTQAWNTVLLQVFKLFVLARVTPAALRQLLASTSISKTSDGNAAAASTAASPADAVSSASSKAAGARRTSMAAVGSTPVTASQEVADSVPQVPDDDSLAASNVYSVVETCLLSWMSVHMAKAFPQKAMQVTNFSQDLRNGLVLGALLAAYWPGGTAGTLLTKLHQNPKDARLLKENQDMVVKALQELSLPFELSTIDLEECDSGNMLAAVTYLFTALPQLLPRATLNYLCKLGEQQSQSIQLSNPTKRMLSYTARLEGHTDFSLEGSVFKIEPGRSIQVPVNFAPTTSVAKTCRLVLMSRRDGSSASAATLVFLLTGQVDSRAPLKQVAVQAPLYQLATTDFSVTNPFPADCEFTISLVQKAPELPPPTANKKAKGSKTGNDKLMPTAPASATVKAPTTQKKSKDDATQQQQVVSGLFPEPFGLDRYRLRLRSGASEKLKLSFLPFQMPPLQPGEKDQLSTMKGTTSCLLVLSDSECGEFAYELHGEVVLPAPFMVHKATVGLDGTQSLELQLPFSNQQLEAARRTYADKHPLAKDKEQAAKLRNDIGKSSDKGGRLLEYNIKCSNSLLGCPKSLVLKTGLNATATIAGTRTASAAGNLSPPPSPPMQQQHPAASKEKGKDDNVLQLQLKPVGAGVYPARLVLASPYDVRVMDVEITAQSTGQSCVLEMECPARQQVLQEVTLVNTTDAAFTASATLTGKGFSGPRDVSVPAKSSSTYTLTFAPLGSGTYSGTLELYIAATGERNVYSLVGKGGEPMAEGHLVVECQARNPVTKYLQVPNITGAVPLQYSVYSDLDILTGPSSYTCASANRGDAYKLNVLPLRSGSSWGSISFVTEEGQYCWYSIEVKASEPPDMGTIEVSCPVRQAVGIQVTLTNPTDRRLLLRAQYSTPSLLGPATFVAPPREPCVFECYYAPLLPKSEQGTLRLLSDEVGEFWWRIDMEATPGGPEHLPLLTASLGGTASHGIVVANPTPAEATFACSSSTPERFRIQPKSLSVPAQGAAEVLVEYRPGSLGMEETGTIVVTSETAGTVEYLCRGQGELPTGSESASVNTALNTATTCSKLSWVNPFSTAATVKVQLGSQEAQGVYSLLLPGTQQVTQQPQAQYHRQNRIRPKDPMSPSEADSDDAAVDSLTDGGRGHEDGYAGKQQTGHDGELAVSDQLVDQAAPAALPEAMTGLLGNLLGNAFGGSYISQSQQQQQQQQQQGMRPQQEAEVTVQPGAALQLPVSFCPVILRKSEAAMTVTLVSPEVPAPEPLQWKYQIQGLAFTDARGVKFGVKCKAKHSCEEVFAVPLPGLDPAVAVTAPGQQQGASDINVSFSHELIMPDEHRVALSNALSVQQLDDIPMAGSAAASSSPVQSGAEAAAARRSPVLRFKVVFTPQKAMNIALQLAVTCSSGPRWVYDVNLVSTAPEIEGVLTLEAHMGCTAELPLKLCSPGPSPQPFTAEFTPETPLNFDVIPAQGLLPVAPEDGQDVDAPMKVTFVCKEMGKVLTGKLMVVTPDSQHTYIVKGRQPAYVSPSRDKLPTGTYLTAGTASSTARFKTDRPGPSNSPASSAEQVAATKGDNGFLMETEDRPASKQLRSTTRSGSNYLLQNIKATSTASRTRGGSGDGRKLSDGRPWS